VAVPDVGGLTWEEIFEFREHPRSGEARAKLRGVEEYARGQEPADALEFRLKVSREVSNLLFAVIGDLTPRATRELGREGFNLGISFVPGSRTIPLSGCLHV
jgi:hypothetical protein